MKNNYRIYFFYLILSSLVSCKENFKETTNNNQAPKQEVVMEDQPLAITLDFISRDNGEMIVVFDKIKHNDEMVTYKVFKPFKNGANSFKAEMFGDFISDLVQVEFGRKVKNEFTINAITITYENKILEISKEEIEKYFYINKFIDYNKETGELKTKRVNNSLAPIITLKKAIINQLFELE